MSQKEIDKMLKAAERHESCAVGIYLTDGNSQIAEVEFNADWDMHRNMIQVHGEMFGADRGGWKNGVSPEAYKAVQRLVDAAKKMNRPVHSWVRVSPAVRSEPEAHTRVCEEWGYLYGSSVPAWTGTYCEEAYNITYLEEANVAARGV